MSDGQAQIWRVGAIMNEPLREVLKFCAWYLALGAEEVVICFDNPEDPALPLLQDHPRLRCIACTPEFWAEVGSDPKDRFVLRQNAALSWVYQQYDSGWLLNVDADEFLFLEGRSVAAFLASVPEARQSARIVTAERILVAGDDGNTYFRRPMAYERRKVVYGEDVALFGPRRAGLVGHPQGKSIIRCGVPGLRLRQHWPVWPGEVREEVVDHHQGAHLLHMIGADYDIWRSKLDWRCDSRGFTGPLTERVQAALAQQNPDVPLRELFTRLHCATPELLSRLEAHDLLLVLRINLPALVEEFFGVAREDLP